MAHNITDSQFSKHPHFDLMLPSDEMLANCVGAFVIERAVCHEWPLSCVERVVFEGEITKYCKIMRSRSIEIEAYSSLRSTLLVPYSVVVQSPDSDVLLLDSYPGQRLSLEVVKKVGIQGFIDNLKGKLSKISGNKPAFVDLSTAENVRKNLTVMVERLYRQFGNGTAIPIDSSLLLLADQCVDSPEISAAFTDKVIYSNGDLSADNILVSGDDMRVIDWQFPRVTSFSVELVNLYSSLGIDPKLYLSDQVISAGLLCKIRWFAECADVWLPKCSYHADITKLLGQIGNLRLKT